MGKMLSKLMDARRRRLVGGPNNREGDAMEIAAASITAQCPYCAEPAVRTSDLPAEHRERLTGWLGERPVPLLSAVSTLRLCHRCDRLFEANWWPNGVEKLPFHQTPCPRCESRAALAPFVDPARRVHARRRFQQLAHQSMCLYCEPDGDRDPLQVCRQCAVEPKIFLCTRCGTLCRWSDSKGQPFRVFEAVD